MRLGLLAIALLLCPPPLPADTGEWIPTGSGLAGEEVIALAPQETPPHRVFAATRHAVYESLDGGESWVERHRLPAGTVATALAVTGSKDPTLLLGTDHGLLASFDVGRQWTQVFSGTGEGQNDCTHVSFHPSQPDTAFLGTTGGLFVTRNGGREWQQVRLPRAARRIIHVAADWHQPDRLFITADSGLYIGSLDRGGWQRRAINVIREDAEGLEVEESHRSETGEGTDILYHLGVLALDPQQAGTAYLASDRGLLRSTDGGLSWHWLPVHGLTSRALTDLAVRSHSPATIYVATSRGIARFEPSRSRWEPLTSGLVAGRINDIAATANALWVATDQGVYRYDVAGDELSQSEPPSAQELLANFQHEPAIGDVREAAIRYAEVQPEKIRRWRAQANLKALLPTFGVGLDRDDRLSITSRGSTNDPDTDRFLVTEDPSRSLNFSWRWDLGELIWNDDQTSIDVRSKLMVQLRDDIVDEVTRTYFERRRLQVVLLTNPPKDQQGLLEKELRLQELTALLDGLTGGFFSRSMELNGNHGRHVHGQAGAGLASHADHPI